MCHKLACNYQLKSTNKLPPKTYIKKKHQNQRNSIPLESSCIPSLRNPMVRSDCKLLLWKLNRNSHNIYIYIMMALSLLLKGSGNTLPSQFLNPVPLYERCSVSLMAVSHLCWFLESPGHGTICAALRGTHPIRASL